MRIRVRRILQLLLMPLVFTGCHDNLFLEKGGGVGDITFRVSTAQMKATAQSGVTSRATRTVAGHAVYLSTVIDRLDDTETSQPGSIYWTSYE